MKRIFSPRTLAAFAIGTVFLATFAGSWPGVFAQEQEGTVLEAPAPVQERISFWRTEQNQAMGPKVVLLVPFDSRVVLFRNEKPLQFQGWGGFLHRHVPELSDGEVLTRSMNDLTPLLRGKIGDFVLLSISARGGMEVDFSREEYSLLTARIGGVLYNVINLVITGEGRIEIEAEREDRYGEAGEYFHWDAESVFLMYRK